MLRFQQIRVYLGVGHAREPPWPYAIPCVTAANLQIQITKICARIRMLLMRKRKRIRKSVQNEKYEYWSRCVM